MRLILPRRFATEVSVSIAIYTQLAKKEQTLFFFFFFFATMSPYHIYYIPFIPVVYINPSLNESTAEEMLPYRVCSLQQPLGKERT